MSTCLYERSTATYLHPTFSKHASQIRREQIPPSRHSLLHPSLSCRNHSLGAMSATNPTAASVIVCSTCCIFMIPPLLDSQILIVSLQLTEWLLIAVTAGLIVARINLRLRINRQQFAPSDGLIFLAWCCSLTIGSLDIIFAKVGILHQDVDYALRGFNGAP